MTDNKENMITKRQAATEVQKYAKNQEMLTIANIVIIFVVALALQFSFMAGSIVLVGGVCYNAFFLYKARGTLAYLKEKYF